MHLLELARYLPLNPVRASLCETPEAWPWSSYTATIGLRAMPWFLTPRWFLDAFWSRDAYVDWVAQGVDASRLDKRGIPMASSLPTTSLARLLADDNLDAAIALAHVEHGFSQAAIARHLGVSTSQVSRRLARERLQISTSGTSRVRPRVSRS